MVDWNGIGDSATFNQDKFNTEMDEAGLKSGIINSKLYNG